MAKQIEGISERILAAAQAEFPDKGYTKSTLRAIAAADTGANSIYVCFGDKEGLFSAIAESVLSGMTERFLKLQEAFHRLDQAAQSARLTEWEDGGTMELVDYMYDHLDAFRLLPDASSGTRCHRTGFRAVFGSRTEARHAAGNGSFPSDHQLAKPNSRGRTPLWRNKVLSSRAVMRSSSHRAASTPTSRAASGRPPAGSSEPPTPENERAPPAAGSSGRRGRSLP